MTKITKKQTISLISAEGAPVDGNLISAFAGPLADFEVKVHARSGATWTVLKGHMTETLMYSHVNAMEWTLQASGGTADIEIVQDGESRWIEYVNGCTR
jgi:hypothetical protein